MFRHAAYCDQNAATSRRLLKIVRRDEGGMLFEASGTNVIWPRAAFVGLKHLERGSCFHDIGRKSIGEKKLTMRHVRARADINFCSSRVL